MRAAVPSSRRRWRRPRRRRWPRADRPRPGSRPAPRLLSVRRRPPGATAHRARTRPRWSSPIATRSAATTRAGAAPARSTRSATAPERRRDRTTRVSGGRPTTSDLVAGPDGELRCRWGAASAEYLAYHDSEWGRPVRDDRGLYERLCLEAFQSGLSWLTILRKREAFRRGFAGFEIEKVAGFGARDTKRLLSDAAIVRNRAKIDAAIANARAAMELGANGGWLTDLIWSFELRGRRRAPRSYADVPAQTDESRALARELKARGFRFVGPTTAYALMQACGLVNDHLAGCAVRGAVEEERRRARDTS